MNYFFLNVTPPNNSQLTLYVGERRKLNTSNDSQVAYGNGEQCKHRNAVHSTNINRDLVIQLISLKLNVGNNSYVHQWLHSHGRFSFQPYINVSSRQQDLQI